MTAPAAPPTDDEFLDALRGAFAASASPAQALGLVAAAGPSCARIARRIQDALSTGTLAQALARAGVVSPDEAPVVSAGESAGRVTAALGWVVDRRRTRRVRRRAIAGAVTGPLALAALALLTEPLPALITGGGSIWRAIGNVVLLAAGTAGALVGIPKLFANRRAGALLRSAFASLPFVRTLVRLSAEDDTACVIAAFASAGDLGPSVAVARSTIAPPFSHALNVNDTALPRAAGFSEAFALALAVGVRAQDLPARFSAYHAAASTALTSYLRGIARILAFVVAGAITLHGVSKMLSGSLPGLGGELGNTPEMKELERELDSVLH